MCSFNILNTFINLFVCPASDGDPGQPQQGGGQRRTDLRVCGPGILPRGHVAPYPA